MKTMSLILRTAASAVLASMLLASCSDSPEKMITSAKDFLGQNDNKAAVIQLKNALQANPDLAEARFLLGQALLQSGDAAGSETELRKARALQHPEVEVVPLLARAVMLQGHFREVTGEFGKTELSTAQAQANVLTTVASAWSAQDKPELSKAALAAALKAQPDYAPALIVQARQKVVQRDFAGALAAVDDVLARAPKDEEAFKLKGDVLFYANNQPADALANYRQAVLVKPDFIAGQVGVISVLLSQGNLAEAGKEIDTLKKFAAKYPQTRYLEGQLAYQKKDFKTAQDLAQQLLRVAPNNPRALQLAGATEFQLDSMVVAEGYLAKAVQIAPELAMARRLLVLAYLRSGQVQKALAALPPDLAKNDHDIEMLSVAGQAYLQSGDVARAQDYFARAAKLDPTNPNRRTTLAMTRMMNGQSDMAFGDLQEIAASDAGTTADMALISAFLQRRDFGKALKAIDVLEKKKPADPMAAHLRGRILLDQKDTVGARKSFERSLVIGPDYFPAVAALAALDMADKKPQDARKRFEALVEKNPKNAQALLALAELGARTGASKDDVAALIGKAVAANPADAKPHQILIEYHLRNNNAKLALSAAQNAVAAVPDNPDMLDTLGRAQLAAGETNQAVATYSKLATMQPLSPQPLLRLAGAHLVAKNPEAAAQTLRKALEIQPDLLKAQQGLAFLAMQGSKVPDALGVSRDIQKQRPKEAVGYLLEGDIHVVQKNWEPAAAAYRAGLKQVASSELAIKLHAVLLKTGKKIEAEKLAADWQKDNPKDVAFPFYLGDRATAASDYAQADKHYQQVLKIQPNNAVTYNNLAWIAGKLGKEGAVAYAEKANTLAPNQPAFMDTLAMLLSEKREHAKATELERKAVELQPGAPLFKLNLAKIQIRAGDKAGAKLSLDELTKLGDKFNGQAEVERLRKEM
jgi:putative PEP-CTERM system TPR-repeat lipoprotein